MPPKRRSIPPFLKGRPADTDPADPIRTGGRTGDPAAWGSAAFMLAQGWSTSEVATWLGCDRSTVWRTLKRSEELRRRVDAEKALLAAEAASRLAGLREEAVACLDHAIRKRGDVRVAMWLCDRLGLVAAARRRGAPSTSVCDHAPAAHAPAAARFAPTPDPSTPDPSAPGPSAPDLDDPFRDAEALGTPVHIDGLTRPAFDMPAPAMPAAAAPAPAMPDVATPSPPVVVAGLDPATQPSAPPSGRPGPRFGQDREGAASPAPASLAAPASPDAPAPDVGLGRHEPTPATPPSTAHAPPESVAPCRTAAPSPPASPFPDPFARALAAHPARRSVAPRCTAPVAHPSEPPAGTAPAAHPRRMPGRHPAAAWRPGAPPPLAARTDALGAAPAPHP